MTEIPSLAWRSSRHRTAIVRPDLSLPARKALGDSIIGPLSTVLDFGSGRGLDVQRLQRMGLHVTGWDPHFDDRSTPTPHDVVLLTYVLNVIEDAAERQATLASAWANTRQTLVVSSRLTWESRRVRGESFDDGVITSRGTFQHLYQPTELRELVERVTGTRCVSAIPGVVYAFRQERDRMAYLARRTLPQFDWSPSDDHASALSMVTEFAESRGRMPAFDEIPAPALPLLGLLSAQELKRVVNKVADNAKVAAGASRTTLETLLFLGIQLFNGPSTYANLPLSVQIDVRKFFRSYREACLRAERLLLKLRDDAYLRGAMRNSVGKLTPTALYVHRRAIDLMPIVLRLYEHCGSVAAGRPEQYTLVKLHHDRRAVAWLGYPDFDRDPHPRTAWSYQVTFPDFKTNFQDYSSRVNRPLLHRKEEFVGSNDPERAKYARLTQAEIKAGLYANPHLIGTEDGWTRELMRCGVTLRGHRVVKALACE